ncbi:hypothetical protein [Mesotoga prima]|jgi:hypothetical protein|uniref:hypothetical protein n=1 Tax=Mesotoga prima TaxID=1184387 RepID=UPI002FD8FA9C
MTTIELKKQLIHRISEIEDANFLKALKTILDSKLNEGILNLTADQRDEIIASREDVKKGLVIDNALLDKEIKAWLNAR